MSRRARSNAAIKKERLEIRPRNNAPRSVEQKIKYAITLAQKGNLTKSNSVITKELIPAIDDTTVVKLAEKHPERPLTFHDRYWPDDEDAKAFWGSQEGVDALRTKFSTSNIRKWVRSRRPCGAPDADGWRTEHLLFMLMNDDSEFHDLYRSELILPVIFGDFHMQDLHEHSGGWLFD